MRVDVLFLLREDETCPHQRLRFCDVFRSYGLDAVKVQTVRVQRNFCNYENGKSEPGEELERLKLSQGMGHSSIQCLDDETYFYILYFQLFSTFIFYIHPQLVLTTKIQHPTILIPIKHKANPFFEFMIPSQTLQRQAKLRSIEDESFL